MRLFLTLWTFISCWVLATAQTEFEKLYDPTGWLAEINLIEVSPSNYLVGFTGGGLGHPNTGFTVLKESGLVDDIKTINVDTSLVFSSIIRNDDEYIFLTTSWRDSCYHPDFGWIKDGYPTVIRMDTSGTMNSAAYYKLNNSCFSLAGDLDVLSNQALIVWGKGNSMYLLLVDHSNNVLWAKTSNTSGEVSFVRELPNKNLIIGMNTDSTGVVIARSDSLGNFIWQKNYFANGTVRDCLVEPDGSCVVTGYAPELFMMKIDGNGNVLWCKKYDSGVNLWYSSRGQKLRHTLDSNYILLANLELSGGGRRPYLIKTDINGDTLWTSSAGSNQPYGYHTSDIIATSDGGYMYDGIIAGDLPGLSSGMFFVYKTDSLGKLPCLTKWYPITVGSFFPSPTSVSLNWTNGATAFPAYFTDTISDVIPIYDACDITSSIPDPRRQRHQRIRPNPNNGQFAIEFTEPVQAQSFYSVYNSTGKLLYERTMQRGTTTEEINLSGFGKGLYLIKLTEGAVVRTERVVVE